MMYKHVFMIGVFVVLTGCSSIPKDAFVLAPSNMGEKRLESRVFTTRDETTLLKDGAVILENMGYTIDLMQPDIGLVTATRHEEQSGTASMIMTILSAGLASSNDELVYKATFTSRPSPDNRSAYITRLTLQHMVMNSDGEATSIETIKDKDLFKLFYERLEASTFVESDPL